jgi:M6 family metalloprotease-like protein
MKLWGSYSHTAPASKRNIAKRVFSTGTLILALMASPIAMQPANAVSAGSKCAKVGAQTKTGAKTFVCTKSGKTLVWKLKATAVAKPVKPVYTQATYPWANACESDTFVDPVWKPVQAFLKGIHYCEAPFTFIPATLTSTVPTSMVTADSALLNLDACKLTNQRNNGTYLGFPPSRDLNFFSSRRHPGPNTRFQVIAVETNDSAKADKSPTEEYGHYFEYLEKTLEYLSDGDSNVTFNVPSKYTKMDVNLESFGIGSHGYPTDIGRKFFDSAVKAVDAEVDFSKVDMAILVIPAKSKAYLLGAQPWGSGNSAEGDVRHIFSMNALSGLNETNREFTPLQPLTLLHELYHTGLGLDDHYGDQQWTLGADLGMAQWGLMNTSKSDVLTWEKWLIGFTLDSQVRCASPNTDSTHWLVPTGVKSTKSKLLVIPVSSSKAVVVESIRDSGLNFKLPNSSLGALVYTVDTAELRHGYGMSIVMPISRKLMPESQANPMVGADAPLRRGEYVDVSGVRIKVVESGEFGDVISVSKAG